MKLHDDIHNYCEHIILERIIHLELDKTKDEDYLADLCCLVLNKMQPRYIRYEVDFAFYLPSNERQKMEMEAAEAIDKAIKFLDERQN
jgi:hypothetical protein